MNNENMNDTFKTICSYLVPVMFAGFTYVISNQQDAIDQNSAKLWEVKSTMVTEAKMENRNKQLRDYIDVRIQPIEASQKEMMRTITENAADQRDDNQKLREQLSQITNVLVQKEDKQ